MVRLRFKSTADEEGRILTEGCSLWNLRRLCVPASVSAGPVRDLGRAHHRMRIRRCAVDDNNRLAGDRSGSLGPPRRRCSRDGSDSQRPVAGRPRYGRPSGENRREWTVFHHRGAGCGRRPIRRTSWPNTKHPHQLVYYPGSTSEHQATVFHIKPGEHRQHLVMWLDPPLKQDSVTMRVFDRSGNPAANTFVQTSSDGVLMESTRTDKPRLGPVALLSWAGIRVAVRRAGGPEGGLL